MSKTQACCRWPIVVIALLLTSLQACTYFSSHPLDALRQQLAKHDEFAVLLLDMRKKGDFITSYYHRYKIIMPTGATRDTASPLQYQVVHSQWMKVDKVTYRLHKPHLGMVLLHKLPSTQVSTQITTPGYQYINRAPFGSWQASFAGDKQWQFTSRYQSIHPLFAMANRAVTDAEYNAFQAARQAGQAYFGEDKVYGTTGSHTRYHYPDFYRRINAALKRQKSLGQKLLERTGHGEFSKATLEKMGY